jgi:EF hand
MRIRVLLPVLAATLLATACAAGGPPRRFGPRPEGMGPRLALFVSPAGEPFRAAPGGAPPIAAWFAGADANGDGALSYAELLADFRRWFAALDTDHDGEIAPAEVTRYETEILPEMASRGGGSFGRGRRFGGRMGGPRRGGGMRGGGMTAAGPASGAARFGLLAIPHPIMSADTDFNRGVSRAEFDRAAATRFNLLDEAHTGRLTLAELAARRRQDALPNRRRRR